MYRATPGWRTWLSWPEDDKEGDGQCAVTHDVLKDTCLSHPYALPCHCCLCCTSGSCLLTLAGKTDVS